MKPEIVHSHLHSLSALVFLSLIPNPGCCTTVLGFLSFFVAVGVSLLCALKLRSKRLPLMSGLEGGVQFGPTVLDNSNILTLGFEVAVKWSPSSWTKSLIATSKSASFEECMDEALLVPWCASMVICLEVLVPPPADVKMVDNDGELVPDITVGGCTSLASWLPGLGRHASWSLLFLFCFSASLGISSVLLVKS